MKKKTIAFTLIAVLVLCGLFVPKTELVQAAKLSINFATLELKEGEQEQLIIKKGEKIKKATWKSSDKSVASVDKSGIVTGVKAGGPVTITGKVGKKKLKCIVTVDSVSAPESLGDYIQKNGALNKDGKYEVSYEMEAPSETQTRSFGLVDEGDGTFSAYIHEDLYENGKVKTADTCTITLTPEDEVTSATKEYTFGIYKATSLCSFDKKTYTGTPDELEMKLIDNSYSYKKLQEALMELAKNLTVETIRELGNVLTKAGLTYTDLGFLAL